MRKFMTALLVCSSLSLWAGEPVIEQKSESGITHSIFVAGGETYIISSDNKITWRYPANTRDGWVLDNGNVLMAITAGKEYRGGAIVEVDKDNKILFEFKGTQNEVASVEPLANGNILMSESGPKPRLMEIDRTGKIVVELPLKCQIPNAHMQTRMARKLPNGNYIAPHLLDLAVREYAPDGKVVWEAKTPSTPPECWPFTAIRLPNGNTHVNLTHANRICEMDPQGKVVWMVANEDLPSPLFKDPCGAQRLPNGNTVVTSYAAGGANEVKMLEITPEKKVVWTLRTGRAGGIHEFQILETNGKKLEGKAMK